MKWHLISTLLILSTACTTKEISTAQVVERPYLEDLINHPSEEQVQVVNFWATWCVPCVEELPAFIAVDEQSDVQVILVSLDDLDKLETQVNPFLQENGITSEVKLLNDPYAAEWIPMVDEHWDGAIPATLIQKGSKKMFFNHTLTEAQLNEEIQKFL